MNSIHEHANDGDDALDITAGDLAGHGLTPAEFTVVMRGAEVITPREARDRWAILCCEREGRP